MRTEGARAESIQQTGAAMRPALMRPGHAAYGLQPVSEVAVLAACLHAIPEFEAAGFSAELRRGSITIFRARILRGVWVQRGDLLVWRPNTSNADVVIANAAEEAARQTMLMVLKCLMARRRGTPAVDQDAGR